VRARSAFAALAALVAALAVGTSCSPAHRASAHVYSDGELTLRRSLGIPDDAKQVILFAQTSHLDIDWQKSFDDYYASFVETALLQARQLMDAQPRAFYSIAEMAYLQRHLQAHPEELAALQADARRGALRIVGGGMTSPDTLLPESEMLFRDLLRGVRFSEDTFGVTPTAAWLPDSFGHAGTVPDVLAAAGFTSVGFSRIDGSPTIFQKVFHPDTPPLPGSTAEMLQQIGSADFTWHGSGGATVLGHFIAGMGLYCEGENIDYDEHLEVPGGHVGDFKGDDPTFTDARIDGYVAENAVYAKTPYLFVPVGCDFEAPKPQLISYLDGYDQRQYPGEGVWAAVASFEDYGKLVAYWKDALPDVTGDLAPAYMGFFGTRPALKRAVRDAARPYFVTEAFATVLGDAGASLVAATTPSMELLTRTDHHDFVTGTSSDDVVNAEQMPLLAQAQLVGEAAEVQVARAILARVPQAQGSVGRLLAFNASSGAVSDVAEVEVLLAGALVPPLHAASGGQPVPMTLGAVRSGPKGPLATLRLAIDAPPWSWTAIDLLPGDATVSPAVTLAMEDATGAPATGSAVTRVVLSNARVRAQLDAGAGGWALTSVAIDGSEALAAPSMTANDYQDDGGLWRLGNEMGPGCQLAPLAAPAGPTTVQVIESDGIGARVAFTGGAFTLEASLAAGASALDLAVTTGAAQATTRTVSLALAVPAGATLGTSSPAGWQTRAPAHVFDPTFYPAVAWAQVGGWAVLLRQSTGVRMSTPGKLEIMAARDARNEQCDVMGGTGSDPSAHRIEWRIARAGSAAEAERAAQSFDRPLELVFDAPSQAGATDLAAQTSLASIDGDAVISAIKPADRGAGVILRVLLMPGPGQVHLGAGLAGRQLGTVDLAERDTGDLGVAPDTFTVDAVTRGTIASFRLQ
jgi:hypothetical protein